MPLAMLSALPRHKTELRAVEVGKPIAQFRTAYMLCLKDVPGSVIGGGTK